ncbi:hypothetical protein M5E87_12110 [Flavonifractor plautii]|nr:hypothetical protein M5E87_12110 [Flavonifractor plautii]
MESIILNLLNLTGEERAAFAVLAPSGSTRRGRTDGGGLAVRPGNSGQPAAGVPAGSTALRWLHTRSAGVDPYTAPGVLPSEAALTCSTGAYGHSVSEHLFALLLALMKRLPSYRDQQNRALWRDLGPVKTLLGAQVLVVGTGDLGSSFARLCQTLGASTSGVRRDPAKPAAGIERMYGFEALDTLLPAADVVALTLPQTPGTVRLFDKARLLRMKGTPSSSTAAGELRGRPGPGGGAGGWPPVGRGPGCHRPGAPSAGASAVAAAQGAHHTPHRWRKPPGGHRAPHRPHRAGQPAPLSGGEALRNRVR